MEGRLQFEQCILSKPHELDMINFLCGDDKGCVSRGKIHAGRERNRVETDHGRHVVPREYSTCEGIDFKGRRNLPLAKVKSSKGAETCHLRRYRK